MRYHPRDAYPVTSSTTTAEIWNLLYRTFTANAGDGICKHLALAWCEAYEAEAPLDPYGLDVSTDLQEALGGHDYVTDPDKAHDIFVATYYGRRSLTPKSDDCFVNNPREVWAPDWAPLFAPLLRRLARAEREQDDLRARLYR